uniref:Large ribosomal subunit protein uL10-like insertion domain-containing protein n=1 Tax=Zea mays TaxID=4577 RepID=A0A804LPP1_MAIZE
MSRPAANPARREPPAAAIRPPASIRPELNRTSPTVANASRRRERPQATIHPPQYFSVPFFAGKKFLQGNSGLFFTNLPRDDVERMFREFEEHDFARTGCTAVDTVELKEGPLEQFTHEMEPFLRKQGLPVRLNKGVVELVADHVVSAAWDTDGDIPSIPCVSLVER